jgi:uncharacterized protein YndB with AHSA1/START domain
MSRATKEITRPATVTTPTDRTIRIERVFDAPRNRVWRAFTEPELVSQWWGRGNRLVIERLEVDAAATGASSSTATKACTASRDAFAR